MGRSGDPRHSSIHPGGDLAILLGAFDFKRMRVNGFVGKTKRVSPGSNPGSKPVIPAASYCWKVRRALLQKKSAYPRENLWGGSSGDLETLLKGFEEKFAFQVALGDSLLRKPSLERPYDESAVLRASTFNDELNAIPLYCGGKCTHLSVHLQGVQEKLDRLVTEALQIKEAGQTFALWTSGQRRGVYEKVVHGRSKYASRARRLLAESNFLGRRGGGVRSLALGFLARSDAYMDLRFPVDGVVYENITFSAAGLTGPLSEVVKRMPHNFLAVATGNLLEFKQAIHRAEQAADQLEEKLFS